MKRQEQNEQKELEDHLKKIRDRGIPLYLEGRRATPGEIARKCCVCEEMTFMPDYVTDENGHCREIRYDRIRDR